MAGQQVPAVLTMSVQEGELYKSGDISCKNLMFQRPAQLHVCALRIFAVILKKLLKNYLFLFN